MKQTRNKHSPAFKAKVVCRVSPNRAGVSGVPGSLRGLRLQHGPMGRRTVPRRAVPGNRRDRR